MNVTLKNKLLKLIISLFACLAILFAFVMQPYVAYAAWYNDLAYIYNKTPLAQFLVKSLIASGAVTAGTALLPGWGTIGGALLAEVGSEAFDALMAKWDEDPSYWEQQFYAAEAQEIQNTPNYQVALQSGSMSIPLHMEDYTVDYPDSQYGILSAANANKVSILANVPGTFIFRPLTSFSQSGARFFIRSGNFSLPTGTSTFSLSGSTIGYNFGITTIQVSGDGGETWSGLAGSFSLNSVTSDGPTVYTFPNAISGSTNSNNIYRLVSNYFNGVTSTYIGYDFGFRDLVLNISTSVGSTSSPKSTRIGAVGLAAAQINNDNSINYNFALGKTDARGNVNLIYDPNIFDEDTNRFSDPITGATYTAIDWQYFYDPDCRGYVLNFADGVYTYNNTDVDHVYLLYANDALYIMGFDDEGLEDAQNSGNYSTYAIFSEKFDYVIGHKSTGDDTGNDPGTIVDPGTDPGNDPGTGTGTGTGGDNSGGSGSVSSIWEKLGNFLGGIVDGITGFFTAVLGSFLDALIDLGEVIHDRLSALLDMVLEWFDTIPQLFGGFLAFLSALFPFLPAEIIMMLEFGLAAAIVVGLIRLVRR